MADPTWQHVPPNGGTDPIFAALRQQLLGAPAGPTTPIFQSVADHMPGGGSFQPQGGGDVRSFQPLPQHSFPMSPFPSSVGAMTHSYPVGGGMNRSFAPPSAAPGLEAQGVPSFMPQVRTQLPNPLGYDQNLDGAAPYGHPLPQGDTPIDWTHVPNTLRHFG